MNADAVSDAYVTHTKVFVVRIWYEAPEAVEHELRIQVRSVPAGETRYFLDWPALAAFMTGKLDAGDAFPDE